MTRESSLFFEFELKLLDDLGAKENVPPGLLRRLLEEQARSRSDGRGGLRASIDALLDSAATDASRTAELPDAD